MTYQGRDDVRKLKEKFTCHLPGIRVGQEARAAFKDNTKTEEVNKQENIWHMTVVNDAPPLALFGKSVNQGLPTCIQAS